MNMKRISKLLFVLIVFIINIIVVKADSDKNLVNIYLFHSDTCPHCREEIKFLDDKYCWRYQSKESIAPHLIIYSVD